MSYTFDACADRVRDRPMKPLMGYFRFRDEMMRMLRAEERNSEYISYLWNQISDEELLSRQQNEMAEMREYEFQLTRWNTQVQMASAIPLQNDIESLSLVNLDNVIDCHFELAWEPQKPMEKTKIVKKMQRPVRQVRRKAACQREQAIRANRKNSAYW